jgi:peptidoglycan-associated lipoprotein
MHARIASIVLLSLGTLDMAGLNLLLAHRLAGMSAPSAATTPGSERFTPEPEAREVSAPLPEPAREADGTRADARSEAQAASMRSSTAGAAQTAPAASDIEFAPDSVRIERLTAFRDLRRVIRELADDPGRRLLLRGHSDPLGAPVYNLDLAERRAAAVKRYLVQRGAPADRIAVEAVGDAEPADPRHTPAAWARDRRVEVLWR